MSIYRRSTRIETVWPVGACNAVGALGCKVQLILRDPQPGGLVVNVPGIYI